MKNKTYTILAYIMLTSFVVMSAILGINYYVNNAVTKINNEIQSYTKSVNDNLEDGKVVHNLFAKNCNLQVCGKMSFVTIKVPSTEVVNEAGETTLEKGEIIEIMSKKPVSFKFNPITSKIALDTKINAFAVFVDQEKKAEINFEQLTAIVSGNTVLYTDLLKSDTELTFETIAKIIESKFKVDFLNATVIVEDETLTIDQFNLDFDTKLKGKDLLNNTYVVNVDNLRLPAETEQTDVKTDAVINFNFDLDINNISLEHTKQYLELTREVLNIESATDYTEQEIQAKTVKTQTGFAIVGMDILENMDKYKTIIKLNDYNLQIKEINSDDKDLANAKIVNNTSVNGSFTLNENQDPVSDLMITLNHETVEENQEILDIKLPIKQEDGTMKMYAPFEKVAETSSKAEIKAKDGKLILNNGKEININGMLGGYIKLASGFIGMMQNMQ